MSVVLMILSHAGAWLLAIALQSRLRTGSRGTDIVGAFLLHALLVSLIVLAAGSFKILGLAALSAAGIASLAGGIALGGHRVLAGALRWLRAAAIEHRTNPTALLSAALLVALLVRHLANIWFYTPSTFDETDYHLPKLALWIQTGGLARPDSADLRTYFPAGMQLIQAWWVGFLHHDVLIEAASLEWAVLAAAAVAAIGRRLEISRAGSLLAAALFLTTPAATLHATTAMNDIAASACVLAIIAFLTRPEPTNGVFAIAALCLGVGIKPTVGFAAIGLVMLAVPALRKREAAPAPGEGTESRVPRLAWIGAMLAAFVGAYWFLMNFAQFDNPFFPVGVRAYGGSSRVGLVQQQISSGPSFEKLWGSLRDIVLHRLFTAPATWQVSMMNDVGWGIFLPAVGPVSLAWLLWKKPAWRIPALAMFVGLLTTLLLVENDAWSGRFLVWFVALFALAIAGAIDGARWRHAAAAALVIFAAWHLWATRIPSTFRGEWGATLASMPWRDRNLAVIMHKRASPVERALIDSNEPVVCMGYNMGVTTAMHPDFGRRVEQTTLADAEKLLAFMRERKCRYLWLVNVPIMGERILPLVVDGRLRLICPGWFEIVE